MQSIYYVFVNFITSESNKNFNFNLFTSNIIVYDIFSPPVASRIYVYPSIAAYEVLINDYPKYKSFSSPKMYLVKNLVIFFVTNVSPLLGLS